MDEDRVDPLLMLVSRTREGWEDREILGLHRFDHLPAMGHHVVLDGGEETFKVVGIVHHTGDDNRVTEIVVA